MRNNGSERFINKGRIAALFCSSIVVLSGCSQPKESPPSSAAVAVAEDAVLSVAMTSTNGYGGYPGGGIVTLNTKDGGISACFDRCIAIGKLSPAPGSLYSLLSPGGSEAFITNRQTGEVVRCDVNAEGDLSELKATGGSCKSLGK